MTWYQITMLIIGTNALNTGIVLLIFKKKDLASFILTAIGVIFALIAFVWPSNRSEKDATYYDNRASIQPMKTPIPYTYQPQVVLDNGMGSVYLYKWDYIEGKWSGAYASEKELENLEIYRTVITFAGEYSSYYHAFLTIPGYTDTIDLGTPASPYVLRTTKGEFEFMIGATSNYDILIKEIFDVNSDSAIEIDDQKLIN